MTDALDVLALVLLLQAKHLVADFYLQNEFMLSGRNRYFHAGRALHVLIHLAGTLIALLFVGSSIAVIALVLALEFVLHFNIDWAKSALTESQKLTPSMPEYWHALGLDQAAHQATYIGIAALCYLLN